MSGDIFEKNAYIVLGIEHDLPAKDVQKAFAQAQAGRRGRPQDLAAARGELAILPTRLALDALTLAPRVPETILDAIAAMPIAPPMSARHDDLHTLMIVPEVTVSFAGQAAPSLQPRADLVDETLLEPEIDR